MQQMCCNKGLKSSSMFMVLFIKYFIIFYYCVSECKNKKTVTFAFQWRQVELIEVDLILGGRNQVRILIIQIMSEFLHNFQIGDDDLNFFLNHPTTERIDNPPNETQTQMKIIMLEDSHHFSHPSNPPQLIEQINSSPDIIYDKEPFSHYLDESFQLFPKSKENPIDSDRQIMNAGSEQRRQKNSNAIKKIGRIVLDNLREYGAGRANMAVQTMLKLLSKDSKIGRNEVNKRDKFNTYHLRALLGGKDKKMIRQNLRTTRRILSKFLRRNVLLSRQITLPNMALYLNTMKCSALRCIHQGLAVRLQMSQ